MKIYKDNFNREQLLEVFNAYENAMDRVAQELREEKDHWKGCFLEMAEDDKRATYLLKDLVRECLEANSMFTFCLFCAKEKPEHFDNCVLDAVKKSGIFNED